MRQELAEHLVALCEDMGVDVTLREDYIGRAMFGKSTTGIVVESTELIAVLLNSASSLVDNEGWEKYDVPIDSLRTDSLGRNTIIY